MQEVWAPGRVNLIGEHIDYHGLPVLPMALHRRVRIQFTPRSDQQIRVSSAEPFGLREFTWTPDLTPVSPGDWENYLRAAALAIGRTWGIGHGVDAEIHSDLLPAAGLSSSSALMVAFSLCLLSANGCQASFAQLMAVLPDAEQFVGTRGGGMDHAASLASREGFASLIHFAPLSVDYIRVPSDWGFLAAHSLQEAEKSGAFKDSYNARREAGFEALRTLGLADYQQALASTRAAELPPIERDAFLHVTSEAARVQQAVHAMQNNDPHRFGQLLLESHASLRDRLKVSCEAVDWLVEAATASGALGARLTGAGFGGCVLAFARKRDLPALRQGLLERFYRRRKGFDETRHLIDADPGPGALSSLTS